MPTTLTALRQHTGQEVIGNILPFWARHVFDPRSGEQPFLDAALRTWNYIEAKIADKKHGEWFALPSRDAPPARLPGVCRLVQDQPVEIAPTTIPARRLR